MVSIKYRPKVSIKCCPAQAVAQLSKILECAHSGADYHCTLEKRLSFVAVSALTDSKNAVIFWALCYGGRFWLGFVKTSGVEGVGVICMCGSNMDAKMAGSVGAENFVSKRHGAAKRI